MDITNLLQVNLATSSTVIEIAAALMRVLKGKYIKIPEDLNEQLLRGADVLLEKLKIWGVFILCLLFSAIGVSLSFLAFGTKITGVAKWGIGLAIAVIMLGITYGAKYANEDARKTFTPVDLIQYLSQGFLWPSTWPALADFLGVQKVIAPPHNTSQLLLIGEKFVGFLHVYF